MSPRVVSKSPSSRIPDAPVARPETVLAQPDNDLGLSGRPGCCNISRPHCLRARHQHLPRMHAHVLRVAFMGNLKGMLSLTTENFTPPACEAEPELWSANNTRDEGGE